MFVTSHNMSRLLAMAVLFILLLFIRQPQQAYTGDTVLTLPFENISGQPEYNWIGEGFSLTLAGLLNNSGLMPLDIEERNLAYERLGLSTTAILTRATAIKIGEKAGADLLVVGTYNISGEGKGRTISITTRVIDLREGRAIGNDYTFSGPIGELQIMQGKLAWEILYQRNSALPFSRDQLIKKATAIPPGAFESYIKSLMTPNKEDKVKFLFRALSEYQQSSPGQYAQAIFALGHLYYDDGNYKDALKWLEKVSEKDSIYLEARFYCGVAYLQLGETEKADAVFKQLIGDLPLYEVFNNSAVNELKKGSFDEAARLLGMALQAAPRDEDVLFNYGYALWRAGKYTAAANQLNQLVRHQGKDGQAYYLLAKSLEQMNQKTEAATALDEAKKHLADFAKWETAGKVPQIARIKNHFSRAAYQRWRASREAGKVATMINSQAQQAEILFARAQGFFLANRDTEAVATLAQLLQITPDNAEAHLLMGRIQERRGDLDGAINSLKAAVFWNVKLLSAHILLGRIYLQQNNRTQAEYHLKKALEINPQDRDALALERLLAPVKPK
ncbi:MAG: tetratricopeptide repeat protein [Acidobacteriota bacterium]